MPKSISGPSWEPQHFTDITEVELLNGAIRIYQCVYCRALLGDYYFEDLAQHFTSLHPEVVNA